MPELLMNCCTSRTRPISTHCILAYTGADVGPSFATLCQSVPACCHSVSVYTYFRWSSIQSVFINPHCIARLLLDAKHLSTYVARKRIAAKMVPTVAEPFRQHACCWAIARHFVISFLKWSVGRYQHIKLLNWVSNKQQNNVNLC